METGGGFGWKILLMVALLTAGMGGALDVEATDCALEITDWEEYCCVEKADEWSGTVKCTLTGVERQEMKRGDLEEMWTVGDPFTIEGTRGEDNETEKEYYLYLDLGLKDGTWPDEYTANVAFEAYYKDEKDPVCDGKIKVEVTVVKIQSSSTDNFSPHLGGTATIDIAFEPSPPWGTGEVYFKCEIIKKTKDGGKQHIQWVDVDPSDSDFNYGRSIDVASLSLIWNGIPEQPYNVGNASQTTGPATFDGVNGSFNRILPEVNEGEPVPSPLYYPTFRS